MYDEKDYVVSFKNNEDRRTLLVLDAFQPPRHEIDGSFQ